MSERQKPKTQYQYLLEDVTQFAHNVKYPHRRTMWRYPKDRLKEGWSLLDLSERVQAADQLSYDVRLVWNDEEGLRVEYVKRVDVPFQWL